MITSPLDEAEFPLTHAVVREGLADGTAPGFVAGIWRASQPSNARVCAWGSRRLLPSVQAMQVDTPFDLASLTKVMVTAPLTAWLVERGWLRWDTRLSALLPEFRFKDVELRHLLSHTAGFPAWGPFWEILRAEFGPDPVECAPVAERQRAMRRLVCAVAPEVPIDTRALYSDVSFLLLGFALEEVLQMPLDRAARNFLWDPMQVEGAYFARVERGPEQGRDERAAATEVGTWRGGVLQGQVHDDNCWAMGGYAGHAGAFGRARDVLQFGSRLLQGFFTPSTFRAMATRAPLPKGCERTLGWDTPSGDEASSGRYFGRASIGHLGFTGTSLWIDPPAGLVVTLLSNRVHPSRDSILIRAFRTRFHNALRQDIVRLGE